MGCAHTKDPVPQKRNRKCSGRMEESAKLHISQSRNCLLGRRAELERLVLCESFDLCSPSGKLLLSEARLGGSEKA